MLRLYAIAISAELKRGGTAVTPTAMMAHSKQEAQTDALMLAKETWPEELYTSHRATPVLVTSHRVLTVAKSIEAHGQDFYEDEPMPKVPDSFTSAFAGEY